MIKELARDIKESGGYLYIVGGWVRDKILNLESKDIDVEVFGIEKEVLEEILLRYGKFRYVGKSFSIYILKEYEISLANIDGRVIGVDEIKKAIYRRDLTINSLMYDPLEDEVLDIVGGKKDIEKKILRYVNKDSFAHDPLRVLRVASFMARFNFEVESDLEKLCFELGKKLKFISSERIFIELEKIVMKSVNPSIAFIWLDKIGVLKELFGVDIDRFVDFYNIFSCVDIKERDITLMLSILYLNNRNSYRESIKKITNRVDIKQGMKRLISNVDKIDEIEGNRIKLKKLVVKTDFNLLLKLYISNKIGLGEKVDYIYLEKLRKIYNEIKDELSPLISGKDVIKEGIESGVEIGSILKEVYNAQLEEKFFNREGALKFLRDEMIKERGSKS